jgi:hypothetical protein
MTDVETAAKLASIGGECIYGKTVPLMENVPNSHSSVGGTAEPDLPPTRTCPAAETLQILHATLFLWTNLSFILSS